MDTLNSVGDGSPRRTSYLGPPSAGKPVYASPYVRRSSHELGIDLTELEGTGPGGRILLSDLHRAARAKLDLTNARSANGRPDLPPQAPPDFSMYGDIERRPLSRIRRLSGAALARNWLSIPHVTNFDEADITELGQYRESLNQDLIGNAKLSVLPFIIKACALTLKMYPAFNASLDGDHVILKHYVHIGFAADTPDGLLVPVIRDANRLSILEIASRLDAGATNARNGLLKGSDMQGGSFTVSSLGGIGGSGFTPIINAPEVAILGVSRARILPRWDGSAFRPRLILPLALSWDHRALDGAAAARFLSQLTRFLENILIALI